MSLILPRAKRRGDCNGRTFKAKQFAWSWISSRAFPRSITPTDIDGAVEINGRFLFFELKQQGSVLPTGQRIFYERLLKAMRGDAWLFLVTHPPSETYTPGVDDIVQLQVWGVDDRRQLHIYMATCANVSGLDELTRCWAENSREFQQRLAAMVEIEG